MSDAELVPFHLSIPVNDLARARAFYGGVLGCAEGRSREHRVDFDFFGHHIVAHLLPEEAAHESRCVAEPGAAAFPVRHFGVILPLERWQALAARMTKAGVDFIMKPQVLHVGDVREQSILQCADGCGNVIELKGQARERIFAR